MNAEENNDKKPTQSQMEKLYDMLELEGMTGNNPEGFATVILYIEGDVKSARLMCLN